MLLVRYVYPRDFLIIGPMCAYCGADVWFDPELADYCTCATTDMHECLGSMVADELARQREATDAAD